MDQLDRMFQCLVRNVRLNYPELLSQPFEVSMLHQVLIPYRLHRRELGLDTAEEYELALTRLLAGDRGFLAGDPEMQAALRVEAESSNPDLSAFRAFATSQVSLGQDALRALAGGGSFRSAAEAATDNPSSRLDSLQVEMAGRATQEMKAPALGTAAATGASPVAVCEPVPATTGPVPGSHHPGCRYCGGELPVGREVHFCPYCGQNLTVKQCPACSTELEVDWQYCITCGREVE